MSNPAASRHDVGVRPWVKRLGMYLRIFGPPATTPGFGYRTSEPYLDSLIETAKQREDEFGADSRPSPGEDAQAHKELGS